MYCCVFVVGMRLVCFYPLLSSVTSHHTHLKCLKCVCCFQLKPTLSQLHADLKLYEHHFEWLNRVSKKHHHPALPKLMEMIREMKSLISLLHRQVRLGFTFQAHQQLYEMKCDWICFCLSDAES